MEATHHPLPHHLDLNLNLTFLQASWKPALLSPMEKSNKIWPEIPTETRQRLDGDGDPDQIHRPASQVKIMFLRISTFSTLRSGTELIIHVAACPFQSSSPQIHRDFLHYRAEISTAMFVFFRPPCAQMR
jgi:hypothetical protein